MAVYRSYSQAFSEVQASESCRLVDALLAKVHQGMHLHVSRDQANVIVLCVSRGDANRLLVHHLTFQTARHQPHQSLKERQAWILERKAEEPICTVDSHRAVAVANLAIKMSRMFARLVRVVGVLQHLVPITVKAALGALPRYDVRI